MFEFCKYVICIVIIDILRFCASFCVSSYSFFFSMYRSIAPVGNTESTGCWPSPVGDALDAFFYSDIEYIILLLGS